MHTKRYTNCIHVEKWNYIIVNGEQNNMVQSSSLFLEQLSSPRPLLPDTTSSWSDWADSEREEQPTLPAADITTDKSIEHVINLFLITFQIGERNVRILELQQFVCSLDRYDDRFVEETFAVRGVHCRCDETHGYVLTHSLESAVYPHELKVVEGTYMYMYSTSHKKFLFRFYIKR